MQTAFALPMRSFRLNENHRDPFWHDIDKSCVNISVILKKYATFCKELAENPGQQLDQLMTKGPPTLE